MTKLRLSIGLNIALLFAFFWGHGLNFDGNLPQDGHWAAANPTVPGRPFTLSVERGLIVRYHDGCNEVGGNLANPSTTVTTTLVDCGAMRATDAMAQIRLFSPVDYRTKDDTIHMTGDDQNLIFRRK